MESAVKLAFNICNNMDTIDVKVLDVRLVTVKEFGQNWISRFDVAVCHTPRTRLDGAPRRYGDLGKVPMQQRCRAGYEVPRMVQASFPPIVLRRQAAFWSFHNRLDRPSR